MCCILDPNGRQFSGTIAARQFLRIAAVGLCPVPRFGLDQARRLTDNAQVTPWPISTEGQVIGPDASGQFPPILRSGPLGIGRDVTNRLLARVPVASGRAPQIAAGSMPRLRGYRFARQGPERFAVACRIQASLP